MSLQTITRGAVFSPDGMYRYMLWRIWGRGRHIALVIGKNPSSAGARVDDPTVRVLGYGLPKMGFDGMLICNVYGFVSTDPKALRTVHDPVGSENLAWLMRAGRMSTIVIAAWGNIKAEVGTGFNSDGQVAETIWAMTMPGDPKRELHCLAITKHGHPHHPLRMKFPDAPIPWHPRPELGRRIAPR